MRSSETVRNWQRTVEWASQQPTPTEQTLAELQAAQAELTAKQQRLDAMAMEEPAAAIYGISWADYVHELLMSPDAAFGALLVAMAVWLARAEGWC